MTIPSPHARTGRWSRYRWYSEPIPRFRSIFWFLTIAGGISLLSILVILPGTLRPIARNGTVPLKGIHKPFIYMITGQQGAKEGTASGLEKSQVTLQGYIFSPLRFSAEKYVFITLFFGSIVYTFWSMVTSSTTDLFEQSYNLTTLKIGLTFLGNDKACYTFSHPLKLPC